MVKDNTDGKCDLCHTEIASRICQFGEREGRVCVKCLTQWQIEKSKGGRGRVVLVDRRKECPTCGK